MPRSRFNFYPDREHKPPRVWCRPNPKTMIERPCEICQAIIQVKSSNPKQKFCQDKCRDEGKRRASAIASKKRKEAAG